MMFRWNIFIALFFLLLLEGCAQKEAVAFVIAKYKLLKTGEDEGYPYVKVYVSTVDTSWKMKEIFWDSAYSTQLSRMFFHHSVAEGPFLGFVHDRRIRRPHLVDSRFKLKRNKGVLQVLHFRDGIESTSDYCLLNDRPLSRPGLFSNRTHAEGESSVRLVKSDTLIRFNNKRYHAYKIEERYSGVDGLFINYIYLSKKGLIPVYRELRIRRSLSSHSSGKNTEIHRYFLIGILEFNLFDQVGLERD